MPHTTTTPLIRQPVGLGYTIALFDTGRYSRQGKPNYHYRVTKNRKVVFEGDDYCPGISSQRSNKLAALECMSLLLAPIEQPSLLEDVDAYSPEYLAWLDTADAHRLVDYVDLELSDMEERLERGRRSR